MRTVVLVHPPLLGPASLRPVAGVLEAGGHPVVLPDLRFAVSPTAGWWDRAAQACVSAAGEAADGFHVVGFSGAGVLLPAVTSRLASVEAVVFLDAVLPAVSGETHAAEGIRSFVSTLPVEDGLLPPWSRWWGDAIAELVPDPGQLALLRADEPRLTPDFWAEPVPVPDWPADRAGYVRLSAAYDKEAEEAARRGWPVRTLDGTHLDPLVRPAEVAAAVLEVADATS